MDLLTTTDLALINDLSGRQYSGNRFLSAASELEFEGLKLVKTKLRSIADYFSERYEDQYGPFTVSVSTGNPIAYGGKKLNHVWSGISKGSPNKQYSAQVSFVANREHNSLEVGFYFGRASGHSLKREERKMLESSLQALGNSLVKTVEEKPEFRRRYEQIFDFGFQSFSKSEKVLPMEWLKYVKESAPNSHIVASVYPNESGDIEVSTIDFYVSQVIFLMNTIEEQTTSKKIRMLKPPTPQQRAKQAERLSEIGLKGESYVLGLEASRLRKQGYKGSDFPRHVSLESMTLGFDILSLDDFGSELLIEVKTTTRLEKDPKAREFYLSNNELTVFNEEKAKYKLYRVYDIEGSPSIEIIPFERMKMKPDGFLVSY